MRLLREAGYNLLKMEGNKRKQRVVNRNSLGEIRKYILQGESETLEFKESTGEWKELVEKGIFKKKGAGKYIRYELTQG